MNRAAIYLRVSTDGQNTENQRRELEHVAHQSGWHVIHIYEDKGISGAKGRHQRPAFDALLKDAARRQFDVVMSWSVDRLGRSLQDLVTFLNELHVLGVDLFLYQQGVDTTTPAGKAMFQMCGVFAEFERSMMQERVRAGLARARAQGKRLGRPPVLVSVERKILQARQKGWGIKRIANAVGYGVGTVQRVVNNGSRVQIFSAAKSFVELKLPLPATPRKGVPSPGQKETP